VEAWEKGSGQEAEGRRARSAQWATNDVAVQTNARSGAVWLRSQKSRDGEFGTGRDMGGFGSRRTAAKRRRADLGGDSWCRWPDRSEGTGPCGCFPNLQPHNVCWGAGPGIP